MIWKKYMLGKFEKWKKKWHSVRFRSNQLLSRNSSLLSMISSSTRDFRVNCTWLTLQGHPIRLLFLLFLFLWSSRRRKRRKRSLKRIRPFRTEIWYVWKCFWKKKLKIIREQTGIELYDLWNRLKIYLYVHIFWNESTSMEKCFACFWQSKTVCFPLFFKNRLIFSLFGSNEQCGRLGASTNGSTAMLHPPEGTTFNTEWVFWNYGLSEGYW